MTTKRTIERRVTDLAGDNGECDHPTLGDLWRDMILDTDDHRRRRTDEQRDRVLFALIKCDDCRSPWDDRL